MQMPEELRELYPFAHHFVPLAKGHHLHYLDEGQGPPFLMLHGNPTWSFYYRRAVSEFAKDHRVIAPDHMGCGLSTKPKDADYSYTLAQRVEDLESLITNLGLKEPMILMLHDWGGMIGLAYAARHPERVKALIVSNTAGFPLPRGRALPYALKLARLGVLSPTLVRGFNLFCQSAASLCVTRQALPKSVRRGYLWPYRSWQSRRAVHRFIQDIPLSSKDQSYAIVREVENALPRLRALPRLVLWGELDFVFDRHFLARWQELWPDARYEVVPDAGHYVLEDAWPECQRAIRKFLSEDVSCDA